MIQREEDDIEVWSYENSYEDYRSNDYSFGIQ